LGLTQSIKLIFPAGLGSSDELSGSDDGDRERKGTRFPQQ
jgi:hypothetical protein